MSSLKSAEVTTLHITCQRRSAAAKMEVEEAALASICHYCNEKYYGHAARAAASAQMTFAHPVYTFFHAFGNLMQGRIEEATLELDSIRDAQDMSLCASMTLVFAETKKTSPDKETIQTLEEEINKMRASASPQSLYHVGMFLWFLGRSDEARACVERMLQLSSGSTEGLVLKAWIDVTSGKHTKKAGKFFEGLGEGPGVFALMGKVEFYECRQNYTQALEVVNQVIISFPGYLPSLVKKMKLLLSLEDWEGSLDVAQRLLQLDHSHLDALQMLALHSSCRAGNVIKLKKELSDLIKSLDTLEPHNPELYYRMSLPFTRVCGRNKEIIYQTSRMVKTAFSMASDNSDFAAELGYQMLLLARIDKARRWYKTAVTLDKVGFSSLSGIIHCQLAEGQLEDAEQCLDFLTALQQSFGKSGELLYLHAMLAVKKQRPADEVTNLLNEAVETHISALQGLSLGAQYMWRLNPEFLLDIVKEYLALCPTKPDVQGRPPTPHLKHCSSLLNTVVQCVPSHIQARYLLAKVRYQSGDAEAARDTLHTCLDRCPSHADAHLLMAQIHLLQENFTSCSQALELCLSHDFAIRELPLYHLIKARARKKTGHLAEAIETLKTAVSLPGMRESLSPSNERLSPADCVSVFLELAEALWLIGQKQEAAKVMQDAISEFSGSPEELRVTVATADLALVCGDVELALSVLRDVTPEQANYIEAQEKMADIYLNHMKDKELFMSCYEEMVKRHPNPRTYSLLGDAHMRVHDPEKAIEVYQHARVDNSEDAVLARKIGKALIRSHSYMNALQYYEFALKSKQLNFLCHEVAELLLRLRQYERCEKILSEAVASSPVNELPVLMDMCQCLVLLAQVQNEVGKGEESSLSLQRAQEMLDRVLKWVESEQPSAVANGKRLAAEICTKVAKQCTAQGSSKNAVELYAKALLLDATDRRVNLELARLCLALDDLDACKERCSAILKVNQDDEDAILIIVDLLFRKQDNDQAILHCQRLLMRTPDSYPMLSRLINLLRREGKLEEVPTFLEKAQKHRSGKNTNTGFNFCKGLYLRYAGDANEALRCFNMARKDKDWGQEAVFHMAEIYLNPDIGVMGGVAFKSLYSDTTNAAERQVAARTAEKLLKDFNPQTAGGYTRRRVLESLMATRQSSDIDKAMAVFTEMAQSEENYLMAVLAMARANMMLNKPPQARKLLKRVAKVSWSAKYAEDFENIWLLLADIYIHSGMYDMADDLLRRCLSHNKSCGKAYEYLGYMKEKERMFREAALNYQLAWNHTTRTNRTLGYRLAFSYLSAKRPIDTIDVCHEVLAAHPRDAQIRADILERARASLKPRCLPVPLIDASSTPLSSLAGATSEDSQVFSLVDSPNSGPLTS